MLPKKKNYFLTFKTRKKEPKVSVTHRGTLENESIQIFNSFYIDLLKLKRSIDSQSQSMFKMKAD